MNTKQRILTASIKLFNEDGLKNITTNHIAKELGISPGNLYYHFKNKEEIIMAIYDEMIVYMNNAWALEIDSIAIVNYLKKLSHLYYEYRFFQYELVEILRKNEKLRKKYNANKEKRIKEIKLVFYKLKELGLINCRDNFIENLVELLWMLSEFWMTNSKIKNQDFESFDLKEYFELIKEIVFPVLTREGIVFLNQSISNLVTFEYKELC